MKYDKKKIKNKLHSHYEDDYNIDYKRKNKDFKRKKRELKEKHHQDFDEDDDISYETYRRN